MSNKHKVISYTVFTNGIELYTESNSIALPNYKYNIGKMVDYLSKHTKNNNICELNIDDFLLENTENIDDSTFGIFSFVKRAFYKVRTLFTNESGKEDVFEETINEPTTVLVMKDGDKTLEIPNGDKIKNHINHAVERKNLVGIQRFCTRLGEVINERGHSIDDLIKFLSRCDMPIADDGTIVAYKTLCKGTGDLKGMYVDPHTRRVPQNLGSFVQMDRTSVDPNRRNECSNGLHIARREYLYGYRGDEVFIVKIAPEDVIAVPEADSGSKMRVAAYHIVGKLSSAGRDAIFAGKSIKGIAFDESIISDIIAGRHISIVHRVFIGGPKGTKLVINGKEGPEIPQLAEPESTSIEPTEPVKTEKKLTKTKAKKTVKSMKLTKKEMVRDLFDTLMKSTDVVKNKYLVDELIKIRKSAKVSWPRLGLHNVTDEKLKKLCEEPTEKVLVPVDDKKEPDKIDIKQMRKSINASTKEHTDILKAFDEGTSFRKMEKQFKRSTRTLKKIISQYRAI